MGFFDWFSKHDDPVNVLIDTYLRRFQAMGMPPTQAQEHLTALLKRALEIQKDQGTESYPAGYGDTLLERRAIDPETAAFFAELHSEGVRDDDIRWWWNLHDLERCLLLATDEFHRFTIYSSARTVGMSSLQAEIKVKHHFPMFGAPSGSDVSPDRPLPFELKDRVNRFLEKKEEQEHMRSNALSFTSMNAYFRDRLAAGRL